MKKKEVLLDTHALLWFRSGDPACSTKAKALFQDSNTSLYFSVGSIWEMVIKISLKKLHIAGGLQLFVETACNQIGISLLPIAVPHLIRLQTLPFHHRDPFDRLLIAQALEEQMPIMSHDNTFERYPITRIW